MTSLYAPVDSSLSVDTVFRGAVDPRPRRRVQVRFHLVDVGDERFCIFRSLQLHIDRPQHFRDTEWAAVLPYPFVLSALISPWVIVIHPIAGLISRRSHSNIIVLLILLGRSTDVLPNHVVRTFHSLLYVLDEIIVVSFGHRNLACPQHQIDRSSHFSSH